MPGVVEKGVREAQGADQPRQEEVARIGAVVAQGEGQPAAMILHHCMGIGCNHLRCSTHHHYNEPPTPLSRCSIHNNYNEPDTQECGGTAKQYAVPVAAAVAAAFVSAQDAHGESRTQEEVPD